MIRMLTGCFCTLGLVAAEPVKWVEHAGYRALPANPAGSKEGFTRIAGTDSGITFTNHLSERLVAFNRVSENGSGVALGDVDGDGWCDVYFCRLQGDNVLYRNLGNWRFEDATAQAGIACSNQLSTGATFADVDGDGDLDLLVNSLGGGTRLFLNDGAGKFTELTGTRLVRRFAATSLALGDVDLDGDLDLYVANYRTSVVKDETPSPKIDARIVNGKIVVTPPGRFEALAAPGGNAEIFELAERDFLYVNDGKGSFAPVSWTNGNFLDEAGRKLLSAPLDWGLSALIRDLNGDFLPDIIVCNDFVHSPDRVWLQQPGFRFQAISLEALRKVSLASMGVDVADVNRDGYDDLFFAEMLSRDRAFRQTHRDNAMRAYINTLNSSPFFRPELPRNTLFLNRGDGTYAEIAQWAGVDASEWSWGAVFLDVDLDGWEDLLIPTGHNHDVQDGDALRAMAQVRGPDTIPQRIENLKRFKRLDTPLLAFRNERNARFSEAQTQWGLDIPGIVNGFACADLDNDGDLDLVGNRLNSDALLLRNDSPAARIEVRLKGLPPNTHGIGARVIVRGGPVPQQQTIVAGGRYLSCDDAARTFAAGDTPLTVEVQWPNRTVSLFTNLAPNHVYELQQKRNDPAAPQNPPSTEPFFADVSALLNHRDSVPPFDDFQRQPLLPYSLTTQGPALCWSDLDGDGREDLIIGANRGQRTHVFKNAGSGFQPFTNSFNGRALAETQAGIASARIFHTNLSVLAAISNYESANPQGIAVEIRGASGTTTLPGDYSAAGALALSDIDGDGDLDLFVGGRVLPGRYPAAASSRIFLNDGSKFVFDAESSAAFNKAGLVASALFADLDGDGRSELLTALECGEIRIWNCKGGRFTARDAGISHLRGLWTGLAAGDFDNDGRLDLIVGNWGHNTKYERFLRKPLRIYYGDFDANGTHEVLDAIFDPSRNSYYPLAALDVLQKAAPGFTEKFQSFAAFSETTTDAILAGRSAEMLEITTLDSMLLLNRAGSFEAVPLPTEAQLAPVFGCAIADFDGDGNEDVVIGQNLFDTHWETGRLDSGLPLLLKGDGRGGLHPVRAVQSGLRASGQQRAVALADFNADGRVDVAISQPDDETKLFENRHGKPGLRMRFQGASLNPDAIGLRYRLASAGRAGPVRELHAGSGWLSQDSFIQVVHSSSTETRLDVLWPDGKHTEFAIPGAAREILVTPEGVKTTR